MGSPFSSPTSRCCTGDCGASGAAKVQVGEARLEDGAGSDNRDDDPEVFRADGEHLQGAGKKNLLDEYIVGDTLGEGAFGVVYACVSILTQREVAVKMVDKVETPQIEIVKEVDMLMSLCHPNIVKCYQVFYEKCFVCIVMDKYLGGDLVEGMQRYWKSRGRIRCQQAAHICLQMARSIYYLHSQMIVHRDIKGDNYLMDRSDIVDPKCHIVLGDFGTAYKMKRSDEVLRDAVGTQVFWAPEFYDAEYGLGVDIFAAGVVLYGMYDGRFPYKNEMDMKKSKGLTYPRGLNPECEAMVKSMLEKDPKERLTAEALMMHPWIKMANNCSAADGTSAISPGPGVSGIPADEFASGALREPGPNEAICDRRRELVERLEASHEEAARATVSLTTSSQLISEEPYWKDSFRIGGRQQRGGMEVQMSWWTKERSIQEGVVNSEATGPQDKSRPSRRISVNYDARSVGREERPDVIGKMLLDHHIDVSKFGRNQAKSLHQLSLEVLTGAARLMLDATQHKRLVRVVDVVLLRVIAPADPKPAQPGNHTDRFLIEMTENFADGRSRDVNRLPGMKKEPHENARTVADRILREKLNMGDCHVEFDFRAREVFEEENDSLSYPGVRTVYRKEIIEGRVTTVDEAVLRRCGLPGSTSWKAKDASGNTKHFSWLSEKQCGGSPAVKLRAPKSWEDVSGLCQAPIGLSEADLLEYLERCNVDTAQFGKGRTKTLKDISVELMKGECSIMQDKDNRVIRVVDVVAVRLTNSTTGKILVEAEQVHPDGHKVVVNRLPGAKRRPDENQFLTARRVLRKQLRIDENQVSIDAYDVQVIEEERDSPSYPGLRTVYRKCIVSAELIRG